MKKFWIFSFLFFACSSIDPRSKSDNLSSFGIKSLELGLINYNYNDQETVYWLTKKSIIEKNNLNSEIILRLLGKNAVLEKSQIIMKIGQSIKQSIPLLKPVISQYTVWLDGKSYFTQIKSDESSRSMIVNAKDTLDIKRKNEKLSYPQGSHFCYFAEVSSCVKYFGFLAELMKYPDKKIPLWIIWESYPYSTMIYSDIKDELFTQVEVSFEGKIKNEYVFSFEINGQILSYHFDKDLIFTKMFWIAQGISVQVR